MTWLLIPATDRAQARRVVQRIDQMLGYPRQLAESEITRIGAASQRIPIERIRTETQTVVLVHSESAGVAQLRGAVAILVDDVVDALRGRFVEIGGVRRRIREWIVAQGWQVRASLPGAESNWRQVAPRDGAEGSADGVPIPEGAE